MITWLIVAGYVIGFLVSWRFIYVKYIDAGGFDYSDPFDKLGVALLGLIVAPLWPILVTFYVPYRLIIARPTPGERRAEQAKRVKELERKIAEYEKTIKQDYARLDEAMGHLPVYEYKTRSEVKD